MLRESARPHPANDHQLGHVRRAKPAVLTAVSLAMDDGRCSVKTRLPLAGPRGLPMYEVRVMRGAGAGPAIPERAGANSFLEQSSCRLFAATCRLRRRGAARFNEGHLHESNHEAERPRPQGVQRPHSTGNARQKYERYLTLGREAQLAWDTVEMECCYQFADHYFRVMRAAAGPEPEDGRGRAHAYQPTTSRL
jgi:hypothetical protein